MTTALENLRVLDLSRVLAGPWASQMLGDLGADVVKVERPERGDDTRAWGPPWASGEAGKAGRDSAYYICANRNKRSIAIDIATADGQELVRKLATKADVVIENFKVDGLKGYGLDYESIRSINPRLIYCSITGFGQNGPYAKRLGYDALIQAMSGLMSVTGRVDGEAGAGPQKVGVAITDILTGLHATIAILAALQHREKGGLGQHIDLSLLDVQVACLANQASNYLVTGVVPDAMGNAHPNIAPYQDFPTADGHMILAIGNDSQFRKFCEIVGCSEWATDARFETNPLRVMNRKTLTPMIGELMKLRTTKSWTDFLEVAGVPCGPINKLDAVFKDPQVVARGLRIEMARDDGENLPLVANPMRLSETPIQYRIPPPTLDQHRAEILNDWLAVGDDIVDELLKRHESS